MYVLALGEKRKVKVFCFNPIRFITEGNILAISCQASSFFKTASNLAEISMLKLFSEVKESSRSYFIFHSGTHTLKWALAQVQTKKLRFSAFKIISWSRSEGKPQWLLIGSWRDCSHQCFWLTIIEVFFIRHKCMVFFFQWDFVLL